MATFLAGPYTATYNPALGGGAALDLGVTEDGFEIEHVAYADEIRGDNLGQTLQDGVYRGRDCYVNCVFEEAMINGIIRSVLQPYLDADAISDIGEVGQVGRLLSAMAGVLVLTAVAGTPAAAAPATFTANKAIVAPGFPIRYLLATRLRKIPMRFLLLPYTDGSDIVHFRMA